MIKDQHYSRKTNADNIDHEARKGSTTNEHGIMIIEFSHLFFW